MVVVNILPGPLLVGLLIIRRTIFWGRSGVYRIYVVLFRLRLPALAGSERIHGQREEDESIRKDHCGDALPGEFATYIDYTRSLGFDDKPNYSYLRELFRHRFRSEGFKYDNIFDWTEKRFMEVYPEVSATSRVKRVAKRR
ncbi:hypothetical protein V8F33_006096 [Rhypophila sp. PSN 637]